MNLDVVLSSDRGKVVMVEVIWTFLSSCEEVLVTVGTRAELDVCVFFSVINCILNDVAIVVFPLTFTAPCRRSVDRDCSPHGVCCDGVVHV